MFATILTSLPPIWALSTSIVAFLTNSGFAVSSKPATIFTLPFSSAKFVVSLILFATNSSKSAFAACSSVIVRSSLNPAIIPALSVEVPFTLIVSP